MPYSVEIWNCRDTVDTSLPVCVFTFHVQAALTLLNSSDSLGMWQIWQQATTCQQGPHISETDYTAKREPDMFTLEKIHNTVQYRYTSFSVLSPSCLSSISDCLTSKGEEFSTPGVKQGWWDISDWLLHAINDVCGGWGFKRDEKSLVCQWTFSKCLVTN